MAQTAGAPQLGLKGTHPVALGDAPAIAGPTASVASSSPAVGTGWVGLSSADNAYWGQPPLSPPDVQVGVGPNQVMEMVNVVWSVWTKQGALVHNGSLAAFFGTGSDFISDPKVLYDATSQRWLASITDITSNKVVLAVSKGADPTGSWQRWSFGSLYCYDQPILGVAPSVVILSTNLFSSCTSGGTFLGAEYWVMKKADLLAGVSSPANQTFGPYPLWASIHPAQILGSSSVEYMVSANASCATCSSGNQVLYFTVRGTPPTATSTWSSLTVGTVAVPPPALQLGGAGNTVDTGDVRVQDAVWSAGNLWFALNTQCTPPGDTGARACVRLIEVNTTTGTVGQDFNVAQAARYYFYPTLRTDALGDLLVTFGYSDSTTYPGIMATGRLYGDPADTVQTAQIIQAGTGPVTSACSSLGACRYGDYFGAGLDPTNGSLIWSAGEFGSSSLWSTYVFSASVKAILTLDYNIRGGGSGYTTPIVTYRSNGISVTVPLGLAPASFYADPVSGYSVSGALFGPNPPPPPAGPSEMWSVNVSAAGPPPTGVVSSSFAVNFTYFHMYLVKFSYTVAGGPADAITPIVRVIRFGQPVSLPITTNESTYLDNGTRYAFPTPLPSSTTAERWIASGSAGGNVTGSLNVSVAYFHQYRVTFNYEIQSGPAAPPPAVHYYGLGTNTSVTANATVWADALRFYVFDSALSGGNDAVRQGPGPGSVGMITTSSTVTMVYRTQYRLTLFANPGSLEPNVVGAGWYDAGSVAIVSAIAPSGWKFTGWEGTGSVSNTNLSVPMTSPANLTALFLAGLTIAAGTGGSVSYSYGTVSGTVPAGSSTTVYVPPGTVVKLTATPSSWTETFGAWSGATNGSSEATVVTIEAPATISASFASNTLLVAGVIVGILAAIVVTALVVAVLRRRRRRQPPSQRV